MLKFSVLCLVAITLGGCAAPASHRAMSISPLEASVKVSERLKGQVYVGQVTGGKETNPLWASQVDSQSFKTALESSLEVIGYKSNNSNSKYKIDADIQDLHQPALGFTFNVQSTVGYTVTNNEGSTGIPITATGTATTSDAFVGAERLKLATERSIKENIKAFIDRLTRQFGD